VEERKTWKTWERGKTGGNGENWERGNGRKEKLGK
jgi:hypothetical protein